jgi:uncharacterized protein (TIGR02466 family)
MHRFRAEISPNDDNFSEIPVSDKSRDDLFITPLYTFTLDIDNESLIHECYDLMRKFPNGVKKSNFGDGWQSQVYELPTIKRTTTPAVQNLARNAIDLTNEMLEDFGATYRVDDNQIGWWININKGMGYNVYHTHPGCTVIGLYYPKIPKNLNEQEGKLTLLRTDPSNHNACFADIPGNCEWVIEPKEDVFYLMPSTVAHYVTPHFSQEERISIAFNIG